MIIPSPEEISQRVKGICINLKKRQKAAKEQRRISNESIEDMRKAGLFRILQPKKFGGYEMNPKVFFDTQIALASACPSSGWVFGVLACHAWQLALFPEQAQRDVWEENDNTLISSSYAPMGKVTVVEGGYRLSGKWGFSSGCDHAEWGFLGAVIMQENAPPEYRTFLINREYYDIIDDWHTSGLQGSGSKTIVVKDVFIPEHQTHKAMDGFLCENPGNAVNTNHLYRLPFGQIFIRSVSSPAIGAAKGALEAFLEYNKSRVTSNTRTAAKTDSAVQMVAAEAASEIDAAILKMHRNFDELMAYAEKKEPIPMTRRFQFRFDSAEASAKCAAVTQKLFMASGGQAIFLSSPINQYFQDVHTIKAHVANNHIPLGQNFGGIMMGQETMDMFV